MPSNQQLAIKYNQIQRHLLLFLSFIAAFTAYANPSILDAKTQFYILLTTVSIIGLPHGFFDFTIAQKTYGQYKHWLPAFTICYLAIACSYFLLWLAAPLLSLLIFLLISAYHFGSEELPEPPNSLVNHGCALLIGSIPIVLPIRFTAKMSLNFLACLSIKTSIPFNLRPITFSCTWFLSESLYSA